MWIACLKGHPAFALLDLGWGGLITAYTAVLATLIYHGLVEKEGADADQIASVFD